MAAEDEDPMAALNAMRERMAAMAQMAEISQMQNALATQVASSMERIDKMMVGARPEVAADPEAEEWRRKIDALSGIESSLTSPPLPRAPGLTVATSERLPPPSRALVYAHAAPPLPAPPAGVYPGRSSSRAAPPAVAPSIRTAVTKGVTTGVTRGSSPSPPAPPDPRAVPRRVVVKPSQGEARGGDDGCCCFPCFSGGKQGKFVRVQQQETADCAVFEQTKLYGDVYHM